MAITDRSGSLSDMGTDDLPRTLRREREARERNAPPMSAPPAAGSYVPEPAWGGGGEAQPANVTAINVPFVRLVLFFLKAVLAAIPALILLGVILWTAGHLLTTFFPWLVKVQILIRLPN